MANIALIGAGLIGTAHLKSIKGNPLAKVVAICDINMEAAQKLAGQYGARAYNNVDEMIANEQIDAAIVATPDDLHAEPVIKCANAKINILCEKPFATSVEDGKAMLKAIQENGVKCQMAHLFRFLPFYINAKKAVENGKIGEVLSADVLTIDKIFVPTKMLKWAASSSPSWFLLSHVIDMLLWVNGSRAVSVRATGIKKKLVSMGIDTYDIVKAEMVLENGAICNIEANWVFPNSMPITAGVKFFLSGTEGAYQTNTSDPISELMAEDYSIQGILEYDAAGYYIGLRRNLVEAFLRSLEYDAPIMTDEVDGFNTLMVLDAIDKSMQDGSKTVEITY